MKKRIIDINEDGIKLEDGYSITHYHEQDCCEKVYAHWQYLKDFLCFDKSDEFYIELDLNKIIVPVTSAGFRIEIEAFWTSNEYFVPCYDIQNGYYSDNLKLQLKKGNKVIQELDISQTTIYQEQ